jgi:RHS repeat-associated protein
LTEFTDRRGQHSVFAYDALDRLVSETYQDSSVERFYDAHSHLLHVEDSVGDDFTFTYDLVGRTKSATSQFGAVQYNYDPTGRVLSRQVVGQPSVDYDYDPVGNLLMAATTQATVNFAYDARDQLRTLTRSNGVSSVYDYDAVGRVVLISHARGPEVLNAQTYTYDAISQRVSYTTSIAQPLITQPTTSQYDNDNRLLQSGPKTFAYDDNGNLNSEIGPEGTKTYTWDTRNQLASITTPNGQTISFLYDFAGNLIQRRVSSPSVELSQNFVLDELTNVVQKNRNGGSLNGGSLFSTLTGQWIDAHLAVSKSDGRVDFGLSDIINSTIATVDQNGSLTSQFFYEPYGQTITNGHDYLFQYTGRVPVSDNLYYYRSRYYDPLERRFISEDPSGLQGGPNTFSYVEGDPINLVDPSGNIAVVVYGAIGGAIANSFSVYAQTGGNSSLVWNGAIVGAIAGAVGGFVGIASPVVGIAVTSVITSFGNSLIGVPSRTCSQKLNLAFNFFGGGGFGLLFKTALVASLPYHSSAGAQAFFGAVGGVTGSVFANGLINAGVALRRGSTRQVPVHE